MDWGLVAVVIGMVGVIIWAICAMARADESCAPEKHCGNCGHARESGTSIDCYNCVNAHPCTPNWTPMKGEDS